jgi:hypothetical protein
VLFSDTVGFISDLPVQVMEKLAQLHCPYYYFFGH